MSKALVNKVRLILVLALVMVVSVCAGMFAFAKADVTIDSVDEATTFQLNETGIFYHEEDDKVGLNFTASISVAEYEALQTLNGFGYGIVIAPDYYPDLNQANLFDNGAIFGWATYDEENYEWLAYEGEGYQVINIYTNDWKLDDGVYTYSGAIVDILPQNIGADFKAVAYITAVGLYNITDEIVTSTTIEYAKCGAEVPSYVPAEWAFEPVVEDLGIVTPAYMGNEIDLSEAPSGREYKLVDNNGNEYTEGVIDLTLAENQRQWTKIESINGVTLSTKTFDVVDENGLFVWNDEITIDSVDATTYEKPEGATDFIIGDYDQFEKGKATEVEIDGVDYISYEASGGNGTWFAWKPLHSKEYYEAWAGKGITLSASLIVDASGMVNPADENGVLNQTSVFATSGPVAIKEDVTITQTTTLDDILANWDRRVGCAWDGDWQTRYPSSMVYVYNVHNGGKIYVGDFKVNVPSDAYANKGGDILVNVEEADDLAALDLTAYMDPAHVAKLAVLDAAYDLSYSLKGYSIADEIEVTDLTAVDVSSAKLAAYDLVVSSGEDIYYTARIDLYNTTDAVVWAESLTENNVIVQYGVYTTGRATPKGEYDYEIVTATTENPVEGKTAGQFIKLESEVSQNILVNVLPLHTQDYYREVVGNKNFVLYFKLFESDTAYMSGLGMNGVQNYGMYNVFSNYRAGGNLKSTWDNFVMSLDNYLICEDADATYTGAYFDLSKVGTVGTKDGCMMQVEVKTASADGKFLAYIGDFQITTGYETLMTTTTAAPNSTSVHTTNLSIDLAGETTYDLRGIFNEISKAKYDYYISVVGVDNNGRGGNPPIYWKVTFGDGSTINVVANAIDDPATILDLTKEVANGETVADKLNANSTITILAYAPNLAANGLGSHPTYMVSVKINFSNVPTLTPAE